MALYVFLEEESVKLNRRILRDKSDPFNLPDNIFVGSFRLNKAAFTYVLDELVLQLHNRTSLSIPPIIKLAATLRLLAAGGYQLGVGKDFDISMAQPTVSKSMTQVLDILENILCPKWINFQMNSTEKEAIKLHFYNRHMFPGIVGCVDGTHIAIKTPSISSRHLFYNRKGFYSINVLIICDNCMRIRYIDPSHPGSTHDALVWKVSAVRNHLLEQYAANRGTHTWLLGDSGYALEPWVMTPFRTPAPGSPESKYNIQHSKARNIVERTIGLYKNRFRCCLKARQLHYTPEKAAQIANVCAALHNICIHYKVEESPVTGNNEEQDYNSYDQVSNQYIDSEGRYINEARNIRNSIAFSF